jgi:hypothetical protein
MYNLNDISSSGAEYSPSQGYANLLYPQPGPAAAFNSADRYFRHVDELLNKAHALDTRDPSDLVSAVFANQAAKHETTSQHLAYLIQERAILAARHHQDIRHRLSEMFEAFSICQMLKLPESDRRLGNIERSILDLEKQERDAQLGLWKDTLELRTTLFEERSQSCATRRRMQFLAGGTYGAS